VNRIPGFTIFEHHFFPGFPSMAWPMLDWVLGRHYPICENSALYERSVRVSGVPESELLDLMEALTRQFPTVRLFSLPRRAEPASIELGFRGTRAAVDEAMTCLVMALEQRRLVFEAEVTV
jgi:molybdopterin-biosynthesis enzyme MoeA-like protein